MLTEEWIGERYRASECNSLIRWKKANSEVPKQELNVAFTSFNKLLGISKDERNNQSDYPRFEEIRYWFRDPHYKNIKWQFSSLVSEYKNGVGRNRKVLIYI